MTIASTKAIERTAPVFCRSVLAPAAMPRRYGGTTPIIAAVLGLLNMPEPTPTTSSHSTLLPTVWKLRVSSSRNPLNMNPSPAQTVT